MADNWQWIFALSIDDEVSWAIARANCDPKVASKNAYRKLRRDTLVRLREDDCPQTVIHKSLMELKDRDAEVAEAFSDTAAVGISALGVVDRGEFRRPADSHPRLVSIARKSWKQAPEQKEKCILDFRSLLTMVGTDKLRIVAENDATAFCLAEYRDQDAATRPRVLCYVLLTEGVNVGFLINGSPPDLPWHPEAGHLIPARYEHDRDFNPGEHTGCPAHGICFEGRASNVRFRRQWGKPFVELLGESGLGSPLDILSAYAAALAWSAACAIAPDMFLIGGPMAVEELIPLIQTKFDRLNGRYLPKYKPDLTGTESFIQRATLVDNQGILGGLELARRAANRQNVYLFGPEA